MDLGRRQVVQTGAAAAAVAPFLQGLPAGAALDKSGRAPVITIFDHRGCQRGGPDTEYKGAKANSKDDEMCVKVQVAKIVGPNADVVLQETLSVLPLNSKFTPAK